MRNDQREINFLQIYIQKKRKKRKKERKKKKERKRRHMPRMSTLKEDASKMREDEEVEYNLPRDE